jgi:cellulose synthase/poly-beta-1,6-N-acetylglucosamine synthase-like glycosyltransferase
MDLLPTGLLVLVQIVLVLTLSLLLWSFGAYPLLMSILARSGVRSKVLTLGGDSSDLPRVTLIIPTYNEELDIQRRVANIMSQNYPREKMEIIIIDSGSTDSTPQIAESTVESLRNSSMDVRLITETERTGKANAVKRSLSEASGDIVVITDANTEFDCDALMHLMLAFRDDGVGAATGRYVGQSHDLETSGAESDYWRVEGILLSGESEIHSPCYGHGSVSAFRRELAFPNPRAVADDFEMWLEVLRRGRRARYVHDAIAREKIASCLNDSVKQRRRTALGTIIALQRHWRYLAKPLDTYRILIVPSHRLLPLLSPFLMILSAVSVVFLWDAGPTMALLLTAALIAVQSIMTMRILESLGPALTEGDHSTSPKRRDLNGNLVNGIINLVRFFSLNQYILLLAWLDFLRGRKAVRWEKAESTRG